MKYFSIDEAEAFIPKLKEASDRIGIIRTHADRKLKEFNHLKKTPDANLVETAIARSQLEFLVLQMKDQLQEITDAGAIPKRLNPCQVDFPAKINGRKIYLCWKQGDERISHWRDPRKAGSGRKPISARPFSQ